MQEGKCDFCGNHTTVHELADARLICPTCESNVTPEPQVLLPGAAMPSPPIPELNKVYNLAVPNLASDDQHAIAQECINIARFLLEKNRKYGNSVFVPQRVFSEASPLEQINVRIDDKLSRIKASQSDDDEDVELDLIGYLIIRRVAKSKTES